MPIRAHMLPMRSGQCVVRVEEKDVVSPVCIGDFVIFWTRLASSKSHVGMEIHGPQELTAVEPIVMSTCCCIEGCDIQILLGGFGAAVLITSHRSLLRIVVVVIGDCLSFNRPYSTVGVYLVCRWMVGCSTVTQNVAFF